MGKTTKYTDRKFLGKLENFTSLAEKKFEKKHFRAYKRGQSSFTHGVDEKGYPIYHPVLQVLTINEELKNKLKNDKKINSRTTNEDAKRTNERISS